MSQKIERKYGLFTAICMVVGIVIGSGVFYKAQTVLERTNGNMWQGIASWLIGAAAMMICAVNFSTFANRYEKVNGLIDYSEATVGKKYAYFVGWFQAFIYYPAMTSVLAWVSARYTIELFGGDITGGMCMTVATAYLCAAYALNALAPKLAGKFQVGTTVIKLIPLILMALAGIIVGMINGNTSAAFSYRPSDGNGGSFIAAVCATAFAYEGWIIATSINAELKNAKRTLPLALLLGCSIIAAVYILYFIGLAGVIPVETLKELGATAAFIKLFGKFGGTILNVFVIISCLGTLNGLMLATTRGVFAVSARGQGPKPEVLQELSPHTNMPTNSSVVGLLICSLWLLYFYGANLNATNIFGIFAFDSSELPVISSYAFYVPIFIMYIVKHGKENKMKNFLLPSLGLLACGFMLFSAVYAHGVMPYVSAKEQGKFSFPVLFYLIVFAAIMAIGAIFYRKQPQVKEIVAWDEENEQSGVRTQERQSAQAADNSPAPTAPIAENAEGSANTESAENTENSANSANSESET